MNEVRSTGNTAASRSLLLPPAAPAANSAQDRTSAAAQREIRAGSSASPRARNLARPFPIAEFHDAIVNIDFNGIKRILISFGFNTQEANFIEGKAKLLAPITQDLLVDILLHTAIRKKFIAYLPALPAFTEPDSKKLCELCQIATAQFCKTMSLESFDILHAIVGKYRPDNAEECIGAAYSKVVARNQALLKATMLRSFPDYHLGDSDADQKDSSSARPADDFPAFQFKMDLVNLATDDLCRLLIQHGWEATDLDIVSGYMNQLHKERCRWGQELDQCNALESLDEICLRLIEAGTYTERRSLLQIIPLLPPFDSFHAASHIQRLLNSTSEQLCRDPNNPFLIDVFIMLAIKYHPDNLGEYIAPVLASTMSEPNKEKIRGAFPWFELAKE